MGKIVALGGGRFDDGEVFPIVDKIKQLCGKNAPVMLYLPTAGFDDMSDAQPILDGFARVGCSTTSLLLTNDKLSAQQISDTILGADIIFAGGGNLRFLMETWVKTGAITALRRAYENGVVLSGSSSGSMCWFNMGWDDCGENSEHVFVPCMGILPFCNCPHFESENWHRFTEAVQQCGLSGIAAENGAALVFCDGEYSTICGNDAGDVYYLDRDADYTCVRLDPEATLLN